MPPPSVGQAKQAAAARGQRLWGALLFIDFFFVIIFGGAVGRKIYEHWQAPSASALPARGRRPAKAAAPKPVEPAASAPLPAPPPEPPKAAAPKLSKTLEIPVAPDSPRPPKPSLLHAAPRHENATPQTGATPTHAAPAAAAAAPIGAKAVPTEFQLRSPSARTVDLAGAFIVRGGKKAMSGHTDGSWTLTLYLTPNTYRYWFLVNGKKILDPQNPKTDRGASVITVTP